MRLLRVFIAIVRRGGFAAAQQDLNISASTISNHVKALEERLGLVLCLRGRGGFALTAQGEAVFEAAERLMAAADNFSIDIDHARQRPKVTLTIGISDGLGPDRSGPLQAAVKQLALSSGAFELNLVQESVIEIQNRVRDSRLTMALLEMPCDLPLLKQNGLVLEEICRQQMPMYCGRGHPLFDSDPLVLSVSDVKIHQVVVRDNWPGALIRQLQPSSVRARAQTSDGVLAYILSGTSIGFLPRAYASPWTERGDLKEVRLIGLSRELSLCLITRTDDKENRIVHLVRSALYEWKSQFCHERKM